MQSPPDLTIPWGFIWRSAQNVTEHPHHADSPRSVLNVTRIVWLISPYKSNRTRSGRMGICIITTSEAHWTLPESSISEIVYHNFWLQGVRENETIEIEKQGSNLQAQAISVMQLVPDHYSLQSPWRMERLVGHSRKCSWGLVLCHDTHLRINQVGSSRKFVCSWTWSSHNHLWGHSAQQHKDRRIPWKPCSSCWQGILAPCTGLWWSCSSCARSPQDNLRELGP